MARSIEESLARLRALVLDLPTGLLAGFRVGREIDGALPAAGGRVFAVGVGASGSAADLARTMLEAEANLSLELVRGDELPRSADARAFVVLVSYSGTTAETRRAYDDAGRRGARRLVVTSGGELAERAYDDGVPVVRVPPDLPPRAAVGHLLGGLLGVLDPAFPESNEDRVRATPELLAPHLRELGAPRGPAVSVARAIGLRLPWFVAPRPLGPIARRWATQVEENAKRLAVSDELPEALHNAVAGWGAVTAREAARHCLVLIEPRRPSPLAREGLRFLEQLGRARRVQTVRAPIPLEGTLETIVLGVALGDLVSLELARRGHVDPEPIPTIARGRAQVAAALRTR